MIEFIETPLFSKTISNYMSDEEYGALQWVLNLRPETGDVIPGSGGLRKLRWKGTGRGKSSGLRIIYYCRLSQDEIWMFTIYAKNEAKTIPGHILKAIKKEFMK